MYLGCTCGCPLGYSKLIQAPPPPPPQVDQFLEALINFDKENIHENNLKAVTPYLQDKEFNPEFIRSKSFAAAGLCSWCVNIVTFYQVFCDVEPKRMALETANAELATAQDKLSKIKAKIKVSGI